MLIENLNGRAWRSHVDEIIDRERLSMGGFGPFERQRLMEKAPERVLRLIEKARLNPDLVAMQSNFSGPTGQPSAAPASFTAIASSTSETNMWVPAIWTPIPANDMVAGKAYRVEFGGVISTTGTPTVVFTPRCGQSATPASNVLLGSSPTITTVTGLSGSPLYGCFTMIVRSLGVAASGATATGNGFVTFGNASATGTMAVIGGSVATTVDNTAATGLVVSLTWGTNSASNTATCQWVTPVISLN